MNYRLLLVITLVVLPSFAHGAVVINEIAWMGNSASANNEWIELYNDGSSSVTLDGWTLTDGMNLEIELAGAVGAGQFAVLERTDDASAAGTAFLVYTGALSNAGATLQLRRSDDSLEDQVAGGEDWENIGGDNTTKETAQLTTRGWKTGTPTPGSENVSGTDVAKASESETESEQSDEEETNTSKSSNSSKAVTLELPEAELSLAVTVPELAYVNQPIKFAVEPSGVVPVVADSLQYAWNFGDVTTAAGHTVSHMYTYPGTYVVTVRGAFSYHEQVARTEITVVPVAFSLTRNRAGDVQINNDAPYEIDLSDFTLTGTKSVTLPARTVLLPNNTITIPRAQLEGRVMSMIALYDQADTLVASWYPATLHTEEISTTEVGAVTAAPPQTPPPTPRITPVAARTTETNNAFAFATEEIVVAETASAQPPQPGTEAVVNQEADAVGSVAATAATDPTASQHWPYFALVALITGAIVSLYVSRGAHSQSPKNSVLFDNYD